MWTTVWSLALVTYVAMFFGTLFLNIASNSVSTSLAFLRALVWPIYLVTGWPHGDRRGPD